MQNVEVSYTRLVDESLRTRDRPKPRFQSDMCFTFLSHLPTDKSRMSMYTLGRKLHGLNNLSMSITPKVHPGQPPGSFHRRILAETINQCENGFQFVWGRRERYQPAPGFRVHKLPYHQLKPDVQVFATDTCETYLAENPSTSCHMTPGKGAAVSFTPCSGSIDENSTSGKASIHISCDSFPCNDRDPSR